jgi:hypothetical protein
MADSKYRRVDIGFHAGGVISLRLEQDAYDALRKAMGTEERWHELASEDASVTLDLTQVIYVRLDTESGRVGF